MKTPTLGEKVKYLYADKDGSILRGNGNVKSIFLDPNNRIMVGVLDGDKMFNVDLIGVNYDKGVEKLYQELIKEVKEISEEGNKLAKEIVDKYNGEVEKAYSAKLGAPIELQS